MRHLDRRWSFVLFVLAGCGSAATPPAEAPSSPAACKAGEQKTEACNTCTCLDDGSWACTRRACATCEPGQDQTCNDDPTISSLWGRCEQGQCVCNDGFAVNPDTGRCRPAQP
jgi:hypothetical protein